jgi:hypothetical protein
MRRTLGLLLGLLPALRGGRDRLDPSRELRYGGVDEDVTFDPPPGPPAEDQPKRPEM